jgi:iron complex outermembrane receptor protein
VKVDEDPISLAVGMTYRRYDVNRTVDNLSNVITSCTGLRGCPTALNNLQGGYQSYNPAPLKGSVSATEGFAELGIPLIKDVPFIKSLSLDLAGRMTDYSTSGVVYSDKVGLDYQLDEQLRFRATHSQDIRAPTLTDLFSTGTTATNQANYPASGTLLPAGSIPVSIPTSAISLGNSALRPESAQTVTLGTVYAPSWLEGFQGSVDYYSIGIGGALATIGGQNAIDGCYQGNAFDCSLISVNGVAVTTTSVLVPPGSGATPVPGVTVHSVSANIAKQNASGLDLELAYSTPFWDGTLTARGLANFALGQSSSANAVSAAKIVGGNGTGIPYWTSNLSLNYETSLFGIFVQERLISAGYANPNLLQGYSINQNTVPLIAYTTLTLTYKFKALYNSDDELFLGIDNLFNQDPPVTTTSPSSFENPTNFGLYDVLGRRFNVGLRVKL